MTDDEVEAVAQAIARARRSSSAGGEGLTPESVSEHHRLLAQLAIATLEQHRAAKQADADGSCSEDPEQAAT